VKISDCQPAVRSLIKEIDEHNPRKDSSGLVGWNGSHQIAQWVLMHEAERLALGATWWR
jgi:hypothetical protein